MSFSRLQSPGSESKKFPFHGTTPAYRVSIGVRPVASSRVRLHQQQLTAPCPSRPFQRASCSYGRRHAFSSSAAYSESDDASAAEFCVSEFWARTDQLKAYLWEQNERAYGGSDGALIEDLMQLALALCGRKDACRRYGDCILLAQRLRSLRTVMALGRLGEAVALAEREPRVVLLTDAQVAAKMLELRRHLPGCDVAAMMQLQPGLLLQDLNASLPRVVRELGEFMPEPFISLMLLHDPEMVLALDRSGVDLIESTWEHHPEEIAQMESDMLSPYWQRWFISMFLEP